jgi:hypothetical protein
MDDNSYEITGHSPAQVLCMRTNPSLSLIKFLIEHNPIAFNASCCALNPDVLIYPLHLAAEYSESMELLQIFLQLDKSVTIIKAGLHCEETTSQTPLGILCGRVESTARMSMIVCLIEVDHSVEVIENAIHNCLINESDQSVQYKVTLVEILLKANPEAARCTNRDFIKEISRYDDDCFISLMSLFLAVNNDILKIADRYGDLPIHIAAQNQTPVQIDYKLQIYPESVLLFNGNGELP